jgi:oxepin-CoA hydrolase/3-oxo-5,6-dehydrosuberyl-CoA semialdehyde dehydrogenase
MEEGDVSELLESYASVHWFRAADEGAPLLDAATGAQVARIWSGGLNWRRWSITPAPRAGRPSGR